jgi:hypothetical protein
MRTMVSNMKYYSINNNYSPTLFLIKSLHNHSECDDPCGEYILFSGCANLARQIWKTQHTQTSQNLAFELVKLSLKLIWYTYSSSPLLYQNERSEITQFSYRLRTILARTLLTVTSRRFSTRPPVPMGMADGCFRVRADTARS